MSASKQQSGVEWIGLVPNNWKVVPFKFCYSNSNAGEVIDKSYWHDGNELLYTCQKTPMKSSFSEFPARKRTTSNDLLLTRNGTPYVHLPIENSIYSNVVQRVELNQEINRDFGAYMLGSAAKQLRGFGDIIESFNMKTWNETIFLLPPINEQRKIVNFIHEKKILIDTEISNLEKTILLLGEKRSALLTQAVIKGLNLDAPMKDSGIDWIGEFPEHWGTKKVKHLFQLTNEPSIASHGMELLSIYTAIGVRPRKSLEQKGNKASSTDGYWLVKKEDLIVNKLLAWMGAIGRSEYDGVTSPAYDILRPLPNTVSEYYHFLFRCGICLPEFKKRSRGIMEMRLRLYFEELGSIEVPCPPPKEQQEIADYIRGLDDMQIDLESAVNRQIEILKEYRTALISAAVTGKN